MLRVLKEQPGGTLALEAGMVAESERRRSRERKAS